MLGTSLLLLGLRRKGALSLLPSFDIGLSLSLARLGLLPLLLLLQLGLLRAGGLLPSQPLLLGQGRHPLLPLGLHLLRLSSGRRLIRRFLLLLLLSLLLPGQSLLLRQDLLLSLPAGSGHLFVLRTRTGGILRSSRLARRLLLSLRWHRLDRRPHVKVLRTLRRRRRQGLRLPQGRRRIAVAAAAAAQSRHIVIGWRHSRALLRSDDLNNVGDRLGRHCLGLRSGCSSAASAIG